MAVAEKPSAGAKAAGKITSDRIRNVVLVGHGGTGKTSLDEALLFTAGATSRLGRVEDGTTVSDYEQEELDRHISLSMALTPFEWKGHKVNLIDTPGFAAFQGEPTAAIRAADLAVFVVSAADGVQVEHEKLWRVADEEGIARAFVVNKIDRERASFSDTVEQLKEKFGNAVAPMEVPLGEAQDVAGVVDIVTNEAFAYDGSSPVGKLTDVPEASRAAVQQAHEAMVEAVVETDDEMLTAYLEHGTEPERETLIRCLHDGIAADDIFPVLCASATRLIGIDRLADFFVTYCPTPLERPIPGLDEGDLKLDPDGPPVGYVFKTFADPYMGRISLFRLFSGTVRADDTLQVDGDKGSSRIHNLFTLHGKTSEPIREMVAGDIAAIGKVESIGVGDTLHAPGAHVHIHPIDLPQPVMGVALHPRSQSDEEKLSQALQKVLDSDPTLKLERRPDTKEEVLFGLDDTHLDVTVGRLARKFGVHVDTSPPTIPYRETIKAAGDVEGRHKKQSGGKGQYGVAMVKFEPLPRGAGYEFVDQVVGGAIPRQFIPAVDKGIQEALQSGMLAGFPTVDLRATVHDGKYHSVDSDEMSFRLAGIAAVKAAAEKAQPVLLEPVNKVRVKVADEHMGDVIGDINSKRGHVLGMDAEDGAQIVIAEVPAAELQRYVVDLRSLTGGRGTFEMEFDHYVEVPAQEAQKIVTARKDA